MPGPMSDSYDPEWGTSANGEEIREAVQEMYDHLSGLIKKPPLYVLDLVRKRDELTTEHVAGLTEWQWRILRFACERALDSL